VPPTCRTPTCRTVRCRTVPRTCYARIDHTHSLVSGRTERWPSRNAEGFRRPFWLALWGGMICQVKGGEPCFTTSRHGLAGLSCSPPTKVRWRVERIRMHGPRLSRKIRGRKSRDALAPRDFTTGTVLRKTPGLPRSDKAFAS
jgi:hypothetical protein